MCLNLYLPKQLWWSHNPVFITNRSYTVNLTNAFIEFTSIFTPLTTTAGSNGSLQDCASAKKLTIFHLSWLNTSCTKTTLWTIWFRKQWSSYVKALCVGFVAWYVYETFLLVLSAVRIFSATWVRRSTNLLWRWSSCLRARPQQCFSADRTLFIQLL